MILDPNVNIAVQAFLKAMLKESMSRYPNRGLEEHTVPRWDMLSVKDRMSLQRSMATALAAVKSATPKETTDA